MSTIQIPEHWSASEAVAVFEFIDLMREAIWHRYGADITVFIAADRSTEPEDWPSSVSKTIERSDDTPF